MSLTESAKASTPSCSQSSGARTSLTKSSTTTIGVPLNRLAEASAKRRIRCGKILAVGCAICAALPTAYANKSESASAPAIVHLAINEPAPFAGDLYPVDDSIRMAIEVEGCKARSDAALDRARRLHDVELSRCKGMAQVSADADQRRIELLTAELEASRVWYRSAPFVAAVASVSTVAILLTSTILVQATGEVWRD